MTNTCSFNLITTALGFPTQSTCCKWIQTYALEQSLKLLTKMIKRMWLEPNMGLNLYLWACMVLLCLQIHFMCVCVLVYVTHMGCPQMPGEGMDPARTIKGRCQPPHLGSGPLEEQQALLITKPSLQPLLFFFFFFFFFYNLVHIWRNTIQRPVPHLVNKIFTKLYA